MLSMLSKFKFWHNYFQIVVKGFSCVILIFNVELLLCSKYTLFCI